MLARKIEVQRDGELVGHYSVAKGLITVYSLNGKSSTTQEWGTDEGNAGLARLMLSEPWAR